MSGWGGASPDLPKLPSKKPHRVTVVVRDGWTEIAGVPSLNSQISHQGQPLPISNIWDVLVDENTPVDPEQKEGVPEEILVAPIRRRNGQEGGLYVTAALEMASGPPL